MPSATSPESSTRGIKNGSHLPSMDIPIINSSGLNPTHSYVPRHCRKLRVYPNGRGSGEGSHLSFFLALADPTTLHPATKIYAEVTLRLQDQEHSKHHSGKGNVYIMVKYKQFSSITMKDFSCFGVGSFILVYCIQPRSWRA